MKHYHICIECGNPTPEESTNMVYTDVMSGAKTMDPVVIGDITTALTNPENRKEFVYNIADLLGQTVRRKLTEEEINKLQNVVSEELIRDVFKV